MEDNHIDDQRVRAFVAALRRFEQESDPAVLVALFAEDAVTQRFDARGERHGEVEQFWTEYRGQFAEVRTTFTNVIEGRDEFALEWTSAVVLPDGHGFDYRGVTALGYHDDLVVWLRTYYDSAMFTAPRAAVS